jgi:hypothetical protein
MKQKVIKQTLSIVVELSLKEVLTDLAHKRRTTPSKLCASILEEYITVKGMGKSFTADDPINPTSLKPVFREDTPEENARFDKLSLEIDELIATLPDMPK